MCAGSSGKGRGKHGKNKQAEAALRGLRLRYFRPFSRFMARYSPSAVRSYMGNMCPSCQWVWPQ